MQMLSYCRFISVGRADLIWSTLRGGGARRSEDDGEKQESTKEAENTRIWWLGTKKDHLREMGLKCERIEQKRKSCSLKHPDMTERTAERGRCYRFHKEREENWLELSGCHGAKGCRVCLCVSRLAFWSGAAISRQTTGEISKLCLYSFAQLWRNLIFTACLALRHTSEEVETAARLVHWASETHTHTLALSLLPSTLPSLFPPLHSQSNTGTAIKTQRNTQLRYCCDWSRLQSENRADTKRTEQV